MAKQSDISHEEFMSIDAAAKALRINRVTLRKRCIDAGIAYRWGGTDEHPYLRVLMSEVHEMLRTYRYVPPGKPPIRQRIRRAGGRGFHCPDLTC